MNIPYVFKKCNKCNKWLVANSFNFYKDKYKKIGLSSICKECKKEYNTKNKEKIREYNKSYRQENKEYFNEYYKNYNKEYRKNNSELVKEIDKNRYNKRKDYFKEYYVNNKNDILEYSHKYYFKNRNSIIEKTKLYRLSPKGKAKFFNLHHNKKIKQSEISKGITEEQWIEIMQYFNFQCAYSGIHLSDDIQSLDHIIPLSKGGVNEIWNLVPMLKDYNSKKHNKDMPQWYQQQSFFSKERLEKIYKWQEYAYEKWK